MKLIKKCNYLNCIRINFQCSFWFAGFIILQTIIIALLPSVQVLANAYFLDKSLELLKNEQPIMTVIPSLLFVISLLAYQWILNPIVEMCKKRLEFSARSKFRTTITEKRSKLKYRYIENNESLDLINRISDNPEVKITQAYFSFLSFIALILRIGSLLALLFTQVFWATILIIIVSIPLFAIAIKSGKATYQANKEMSKYQRKYQYLSEVMTSREAVDERAVFDYNNALNERWNEQYEIARKMELKIRIKWFIKLKSGSVITAFISVFVTALLLKPVITGTITIGMFYSLVNAIFSLVHIMSWEMTRSVDAIAHYREFLKELSIFFGMEEQPDANALPAECAPFKSLRLENVSFKYPGTDHYVLKNMSMEIKAGQHYAFVGVNGAGKSTISKLLTGLYDNYEGNIIINGRNAKTYSFRELKMLFSVVYQDFAKYYISFKDNIALGNTMGSNEEDINQSVALFKLQSVIQRLPEGINTMLGKIKSNGQDVSGGEWQKIALARSFNSKAPIRILDEPTAALDPVAESSLYEEFAHMCKGRTTIFVSHRLGSIKLADQIMLIGDGCVLECGTHSELMQLNGEYRKIYDSQREWYK